MVRTRAGVAALCVALVAVGAGCEPTPSPWRSELLSVNAAGTDNGNDGAGRPVFSPDGTKVAFDSWSSDLVAGDTNGAGDVFVRDLTTDVTTLVSRSADGTRSANASSYLPVFSPDGTAIAFQSDASDLGPADTNGVTDVYVHDLITGVTTLVSVDATGTSGGNAASVVPVFSPDGTQVAFTSFADDLGPQDSWRNGWGEGDVYLRDLVGRSTALVSANADGTDSGNLPSGNPGFSPDGDTIAFVSQAGDLGPTDTNGGDDIYLRDLTTSTTSLASVNASGTDAGDRATWTRPVFSPDGARIYFDSTAGDLVVTPDADDSSGDVFERDLTAGTTTLISTNSAGTSTADSWSSSPHLSPDGTLLAFASNADDLGPTDTNGLMDVYLRDLRTGATRLVSATAGGGDGANARSLPLAFSPDGARLLFWSYATDLGPPDSDDPGEDVPPDDPGTGRDLYLADVDSGTTTMVTADATGTDSANQSSWGAVFSPDGSRIAYVTRASDLGPTDTQGGDGNGPSEDVYLATLHGADLSVTLVAGDPTVAPGARLTYEVEVTNTGPDPAEGAVVALVVPDTAQVVAVDAGGAPCTPPTPEQPRILTCDLGTAAPGDRAAVGVTVEVGDGTTSSAIAVVGSQTPDPDRSNDVARVDVAVGGASTE